MKKLLCMMASLLVFTVAYTHAAEECERIDTGSIGDIKVYSCKQLWHNGTWHDSVLKNGKRGYMMNGKHITLTPAEMKVSDAKEKEMMKQYQ